MAQARRALPHGGVSALLPTRVYELQPKDLTTGLLQTDRWGPLLADHDRDWQSVLGLRDGEYLQSFKTQGDGGCGLHAIWGQPSRDGVLVIPGGQLVARQDLTHLLPTRLADLTRAAGNCADVVTAIWSELGMPGAECEENVEAKLFWNHLQEDQPLLAHNIRLFLRQKEFDDKGHQLARQRYGDACNRIFRHEYEPGLIRRIVTEVRSNEFAFETAPGSRYQSLFFAHGDAHLDKRRQSFLEVLRDEEYHRAMAAISKEITRAGEGSAEAKCLQEWVNTFLGVRERSREAPEDFAAQSWATYRKTIAESSYYLSYAELLLVARRSGVELVVTTFVEGSFTIVGTNFSGLPKSEP